MHARRSICWLAMLAALCSLVLTSCGGGSGSSGFDALSENAAIDKALQDGECVTHAALTVCPADVHAPKGAAGTIQTGLDQSDTVRCAAIAGDGCDATLPFVPQGFPETAVFRVAVRTVDPLGKWRIGGLTVSNSAPTRPDFNVPLALPQAPLSEHVQIAVLVFLHAPADGSSEVDNLADSGADFAYVTPEVTVQPE